MIRRTLRIVLRLGLLTAIGFALFKFVQSRRSPQGMPSGDWPVATKRSETPLVEPKMLRGVELDKTSEREADNGQVGTAPAEAPAATASTTTSETEAPASRKAPAAKAPAAKKAAARKSAARLWVEPKGSFCPSSHPVKAKLSSSIYHLPGMTAYERTTPDRCYKDEDSAEADGLRKAKR